MHAHDKFGAASMLSKLSFLNLCAGKLLVKALVCPLSCVVGFYGGSVLGIFVVVPCGFVALSFGFSALPVEPLVVI